MKNDAVNVAVPAAADGDEVESALLRYIGEEVAADGSGLRAEENLIDSGRIDSLGLLAILSFIDSRWHVNLMGVGTPRDLISVAAMAAAIRRERSARQAESA